MAEPESEPEPNPESEYEPGAEGEGEDLLTNVTKTAAERPSPAEVILPSLLLIIVIVIGK